MQLRVWQHIISCQGGAEIGDKKAHHPEFQLIQGGHQFEMSSGPYAIIAAPTTKPPFPIDAVVEEEDTFLVLSAEARVRKPEGSFLKIMTKVIETRPEIPGTVLIRGKTPLRLLAIVHDLNQDPTWKEAWIKNALNRIFQVSERRNLQSIALPLLGTHHGTLDKERFVEMLRHALEKISPSYLQRIWLIMPSGIEVKTLEMFRAILR
jgi:hypothetical protein